MASAADVAATDFLIGADDEYVSMASAAGVAVTIHVQSLKKAWESQWPLRPVSLRRSLSSSLSRRTRKFQWPLRPVALRQRNKFDAELNAASQWPLRPVSLRLSSFGKIDYDIQCLNGLCGRCRCDPFHEES